MRVSNASAVMPNIATIGSARMKYGELAQLKHSHAKHNLTISYYCAFVLQCNHHTCQLK